MLTISLLAATFVVVTLATNKTYKIIDSKRD